MYAIRSYYGPARRPSRRYGRTGSRAPFGVQVVLEGDPAEGALVGGVVDVVEGEFFEAVRRFAQDLVLDSYNFV